MKNPTKALGQREERELDKAQEGEIKLNFDVRMHQVDLVNALRSYVQRSLRFKLGRHAGQIRAVKPRLTEQESITGSGAKLCFLAAKLMPAGKVIITETNTDIYTAVSRAIERLKTMLRRKLARRHRERQRRGSFET